MKNQGISLISLIITIIVIIILAAIVIFTGLGTPDSAQLASFTQDCDNVYSAVLNRYADLYLKHNMSGEYRTREQIYMEIASGENLSGTRTATMTSPVGCANIIADKADDMDNEFSAHIVLPKVNNSQDEWYVTKDGVVFNANGFVHDHKVYYNGYTFEKGDAPTGDDVSTRAANIAAAIAAGTKDMTTNP
jgi:type II secretory pathway pseudopilin PulG